ncbi:MAG: hypothetical protein ACUBOA_15105 [Candidatus Loosdrechtia sp.]|uniref:hypothetical protein n=1 Tax=Candidatus Loosdrechtia sp. TaxID=3101272 RepID=UPI003A6877FB|nr:MAG: hypothetical protein QY305_01730 [Candidatus Jettenia sp. AMX2]
MPQQKNNGCVCSCYLCTLQRLQKVREKIRQKVELDLVEKYESSRAHGQYSWEGLWLPSEKIKKVQDVMKKRDKIVLIQHCPVKYLRSK